MRTIQLLNSSGQPIEAQVEGADLKIIEGSPVTSINYLQGSLLIITEAKNHWIDKDSYAKEVTGIPFY